MPMLTALVLASTLAGAGDHDVVPGERIGRIAIGMSAADVHAALGNPGGSAARTDGLREEWWFGGRNGVDTVRVLLDHGHAVQVSVTSRAFRTAEGLSTAAEPAAILRLGLHRSGFELRGSGGGFAYFYDDAQRGIAWEISGSGNPHDGDPAFGVYAVIVHARGRAVAVDDDLLPAEPDETCAPETPSGCE